jgi:hypothetical protein
MADGIGQATNLWVTKTCRKEDGTAGVLVAECKSLGANRLVIGSYGRKIVAPVVARPSRSIWALAASFNA